MKIAKRLASLLFALSFLFSAAIASDAYGPEVYRSHLEIDESTALDSALFWSDTYGMLRSESYLEYSPNTTVIPVVDYGTSVRSVTSISAVYQRLADKGLHMLGGINGDYFVMSTGESLGIVVTDGVLRSSSSYHWAVGFAADGTAIIGKPELKIKVTTGSGESFLIANINKDRSIDGGVVLYNSDYGAETYNSAAGCDVILENASGSLKIGETVTASVKEVLQSKGSQKIESGQMILSLADGANDTWRRGLMQAMQAGETVSVEVYSEDTRWNDAVSAIGGMYALVQGGTAVKDLETTTPPRTAVGITAEGKVIFYTSASSTNGAPTSLNQVAVRLTELGCVTAICLDGGGSTTLSALYPGNDNISTVNKPSDGSLRSCSNYLVLATANKSGAGALWLYPYDMMLLAGASVSLTPKATDAALYPAGVPSSISYSVLEGGGTVSAAGVFTAGGEAGVSRVAASSSGLKDGIATMKVVKNPDTITVSRQGGGSISSLNTALSETVDLSAAAYYNHVDLISQDSCYSWSVEGGIGTISSEGVFTAASEGAVGSIIVSAGTKSVKIAVSVGVDKKGPDIKLEVSGRKISATVSDPSGASVYSLKYDGQPLSYTFDSTTGILSADLPEVTDGQHRLTLIAMDSVGNYSSSSLDISAGEGDPNPFTDMAGHWAVNYSSYLYKLGLMAGVEEDGVLQFKPDENMTRAQFAVAISNYLGTDLTQYESVSLPFNDMDHIPSWALGAVKAVYSLGYMKGSSDNGNLYFNPGDSITRAEAMTVIGRTQPQGFPAADMSFSDVEDIPSWALGYMSALVGRGVISGYDDSTILPLTPMTRAQVAKVLTLLI